MCIKNAFYFYGQGLGKKSNWVFFKKLLESTTKLPNFDTIIVIKQERNGLIYLYFKEKKKKRKKKEKD